MTDRTGVRVIYSEHDLSLPPFAWRDGKVVDDERGRSDILRILAEVADRAGPVSERAGARAMRWRKHALLVESTIDATDQSGRLARVTVVLAEPLRADDLADCGGLVLETLAKAGLATDGDRLRRDLEWGLANTASRFRTLGEAVVSGALRLVSVLLRKSHA